MKVNKLTAYFSSLLLAVVLFSACTKEPNSYKVTQSEITESIYSSVTLEPEFLYSVYSEVPGKIIQFKKETGDSVSFGDVICTIDGIEVENQSKNAALSLQLIQNKLFGDASVIEDLKQEISVARQQYKVDSTQLTRVEKLNQTKLSSDVELEQAQLKAKTSKTRLESLITQKKRSERELKIQQQQAKNTYESALSTSTNTTITSIVDGIVYEIFKENGELVNTQQPIAVIGSKNDFIIRMLVDERDITRVEKDQEVKVILEAYPDQVFTAKIHQIYPKMDPTTQSFQVIAKFITPPSKLYLGLTGEANIIVDHMDETIAIPREYLVDGQFVITTQGKKQIKTGLKSLSKVQVLDGLNTNEKLFLPQR